MNDPGLRTCLALLRDRGQRFQRRRGARPPSSTHRAPMAGFRDHIAKAPHERRERAHRLDGFAAVLLRGVGEEDGSLNERQEVGEIDRHPLQSPLLDDGAPLQVLAPRPHRCEVLRCDCCRRDRPGAPHGGKLSIRPGSAAAAPSLWCALAACHGDFAGALSPRSCQKCQPRAEAASARRLRLAWVHLGEGHAKICEGVHKVAAELVDFEHCDSPVRSAELGPKGRYFFLELHRVPDLLLVVHMTAKLSVLPLCALEVVFENGESVPEEADFGVQ
mmetsp:Transcript_107360/g.309058  ORF Transcript_107360/g.309058 Transcript_107360/m.309058 type:complete len:275 (-) Transcript_107360:2710-3534(-)